MAPTDALGAVSARWLMAPTVRVSILLVLLALAVGARAWEHESTNVRFVEYREGIVEELEEKGRPYFLLFSAEWCHWCHEFGRNTLTDDRVADYLNANFTSIFIDADINSAAYVKYRATGLPFTVFLNPDKSPHFRYSGTLYAADFLAVLEQVHGNVQQGLSVEGSDAEDFAYEPPERLTLADLDDAGDGFRRGVLESFDGELHGLGKGEKAIYPRTFLYLLGAHDEEVRQIAVDAIGKTMNQAVERIYDPVEGGFFRYAETRDWKIPHYEKMADLNAGAVLLILRLDHVSPTPALVQAADKTLAYLRGALYHDELGVFLSFQEADTHYYALQSAEHRAKAKAPKIIERIFVDRLALTVTYLLGVLDYRPDPALVKQIERSLEFVARRLESSGDLSRYYTVATGQWSGAGTLQDYALVAEMFLAASRRFESARYRELARQSADAAIAAYYDKELGVLTDPSLGDSDDAEFLMSVNGLLAKSLIGLDGDRQYKILVDTIVTYFSATDGIFEERLWDGKNWEFTERYVPYLRAVDIYLDRRRVTAGN